MSTHSLSTHILLAGTIANLVEEVRFKILAWGLFQLMPANLKFAKDSSEKIKLWHLAAKLTFQNSNNLVEFNL